MDEDSSELGLPEDASPAVAEAQAALEVARDTESVGSIALAQGQLAGTLAQAGFHLEAVAEYDELLSYLRLARSDGGRKTQRWSGMTSSGASRSGADQINLNRLEVVARLNQAESLILLGQLADARAGLHAVAPMCRGFGRKPFRKKLLELESRLNPDGQAGSANQQDPRQQPATDDRTSAEPESPSGSSTNIAERLAAADESLDRQEFERAARNALQIVAECADDDHFRAQARQVLGMALEGMGKHEDSLEMMKLSLADYLESELYAQAASLAIPVALRLEAAGERPEAIGLIRRCLSVTEGSLPAGVRARLMTDLGSLLDQEGDPAEAQRLLEVACELADDPETIADAKHGLAVSLANDAAGSTEHRVEALSLLDSAKAAYSDLGPEHEHGVAGCEHEAAALLGRLKSYPAALVRYEKAASAYREQGDRNEAAENHDPELTDCELSIAAIRSNEVAGPNLFSSGGHTMSHGSLPTSDNPA